MTTQELSNPLAVIETLFANANGKLEFGEREYFHKMLGLDNEEGLAKIPCLNDVELAESVPPFSLVRYRCLVQDVFEPEFYAAVFKEVDAAADGTGAPRLVTSKYRECIEAGPGRVLQELENHQGLSQRGACYCVPMPGEKAWARSAAAQWTSAGGGALQPPAASPVTRATTAKRGRDDDVSMEPQEEVVKGQRVAAPPAAAAAGYNSGGGAAPLAVGSVIGQGLKTAEDFGLNFPIPSEERRGHGASTACIVKLYDADIDILRLCDSIEVIGVLCVNPGIASLADASTGKMEDDWRDARQPSTALVPRIHALTVRRLPFHTPLLPYTPDWLSEERLASAFQRQFGAPGAAMLTARNAAGEQLAKYLGGDVLAAEYFLMLLVSRSFAKHGEKSLGTWSLNCAGWPKSLDASALAQASGELVPRAVNLEITSDSLNTKRWRPRKDFVANRLVASQLQLAAGTLLVLDETKMAEGQLTQDGVKALLSLGMLVTENKLACDFQSYDVKVPLEVSSVILSECKSIVKDIDVLVPMRTQSTAAAAATASAVAPEALDAARWLLALVTRSPRALKIPDEVMHLFAEGFASARQEFKVKPELAHTWMALARARCLTFGEDELSLQRWREVMELERGRLVRCREDNMLDA